MLFKRHFFILLIAGSAIILGIGAYVLFAQWNRVMAVVTKDLSRAIEVSAATLDPTVFERLHATSEDSASSDYVRVREQLMRMESVFKADGVRGLYVMKVGEHAVTFFVDSADMGDPWHSEPGVVYRQPPLAVSEVAKDGTRRFVGPYTDEYGSYYSVFVPIRSDVGATVAVIAADIELSAYNAELFADLMPYAVPFLFAPVLYAIALYVLTKRQEMMWNLRQEELKLSAKNTQLAQGKEQSDENGRRLTVLIEQLPVGVLITDPKNGRPTIVNKKAIEILGRRIDKKKGVEGYVDAYAFTNADGTPYSSKNLPIVTTLMTRQPAIRTDIFVRRPDGVVVPLRMVSAPVVASDGALSAVSVIFEDMTAEHEIDVRKTEFISIASHQLRTPLGAVKWFLELFEDPKNGPLNKEQRDYLQEIKNAVRRLATLVNQLLNVSRLEVGAVGVAPVVTDLNAFVENVVKEVAPMLAEKHQTFSTRRALLPPIKIDPKLVREVLMNLLSNASKYTPEGGRISLATEARATDILLSVSDTGIGIPPAQQKDIFQKFYRADNAAESGTEGTGLGLYIAKQAAEMSGGTIGFTSKEHEGSVFWFTLPLSGSVEKTGKKPLEVTGNY